VKKPRDWDCGKDGHIPLKKRVKSHGLAKVMITYTWCGVCGKKL
jgi:hypothetical protein